jgi:hypothetical protein
MGDHSLPAYKTVVRDLKARDNVEDLNVDGRIILR